MKRRRRVRTIHRDDVHPRQHLVEAFPIGRAQLFGDARRHRPAVVIVDREAERPRAARHGLADAAHADDAETLAPDAVAEHPGRRPARPVLAVGEDGGALDQPARHRQNQRHGHVGGVFGQNFRRIGHGDAARVRRDDIDIVDAVAEIGDQLQLAIGLFEQRFGDLVGDGRHQHIGRAHRVGDLLWRQRRIVEIESRVEQLAHAGLDRVRQLARDDNERLFLNRHVLLA